MGKLCNFFNFSFFVGNDKYVLKSNCLVYGDYYYIYIFV